MHRARLYFSRAVSRTCLLRRRCEQSAHDITITSDRAIAAPVPLPMHAERPGVGNDCESCASASQHFAIASAATITEQKLLGTYATSGRLRARRTRPQAPAAGCVAAALGYGRLSPLRMLLPEILLA